MLKDNPVVKKIVETGEERIGKLAQQLLANEKFVAMIQKLVSSSLAAKGTIDKSIKTALAAMNVPSSSEVDELKARLSSLERAVASLKEQLNEAKAGESTRK